MNSLVDSGRQLMSPPLLRGRNVLVTGANSGIGKAAAVALGRAGADVVVNYAFDPEAADEVVQETQGFGVRAYAHQVAKVVEECGTIDMPVADAGLQRDAAITEMTVNP
ncbi:SDR family NAD(P)-dependent oxidoreductase [Streptacidiphilus sp. 4-A2]|nr:SDR family NAD(P)-dependent oxidoreductase [Streptacidiphilus sp. 4-A2]